MCSRGGTKAGHSRHTISIGVGCQRRSLLGAGLALDLKIQGGIGPGGGWCHGAARGAGGLAMTAAFAGVIGSGLLVRPDASLGAAAQALEDVRSHGLRRRRERAQGKKDRQQAPMALRGS